MTGYQKLWLLATYGTPQAIPKRRGGSIFAMRKTPSSFCEMIGPGPAGAAAGPCGPVPRLRRPRG